MSYLAFTNSFEFDIPTLWHVCLALLCQIHMNSTFLPFGMYILPCFAKFISIQYSYPWACMPSLAFTNSFVFDIPTLGHVSLPCLVKFICIRHSYPWACILPCLDKFIWILENSCFLAFSMHAEHIIELSALGHVCLAKFICLFENTPWARMGT